tara:strand:+ start:1668 stop:2108 length:441 start_codon:yes stop_codon:yes gene_type:complete
MNGCKARVCTKNVKYNDTLKGWNSFKRCNQMVYQDGFCKMCFSKDTRKYVGTMKRPEGGYPWDARWKRDGIHGEPYDFPYHTEEEEGSLAWVEKIYTLHPDIRPQKDDYEDDYEQRQRAVREWLDKYSTKIDYKMGKELEKIISKS